MRANASVGVLGVAWGRRSALLMGVCAAAPLAGAGARAAEFTAGSEAELAARLAEANASPDASSTIVLTQSFDLTATLGTISKNVTIDTGAFTLGGRLNVTTTNGNTLTVSGNVTGGAGKQGLYVDSATMPSVVVNNATVTGGAGGNGADVSTTTLTNNGTIKGGSASPSNGFGVALRRGSILINNGTIEGGYSSVNGNGVTGIDMGGPGAGTSLVNNGLIRGGTGISGTGGVGINVRASASGDDQPIVNNTTGVIEGGAGAYAITAPATVNLVIVNAGTIRAGAGQATAIGFMSPAVTGTITLELQAGSNIEGNVVGNANAGPLDTLRLGGDGFDSFDVAAIGTQYLNFDTLQKVGAGTWALPATVRTRSHGRSSPAPCGSATARKTAASSRTCSTTARSSSTISAPGPMAA